LSRYLEQKQVHIGRNRHEDRFNTDIKNETVKKYMTSMFNLKKKDRDIYELPLSTFKIKKAQEAYEKIITKPRVYDDMSSFYRGKDYNSNRSMSAKKYLSLSGYAGSHNTNTSYYSNRKFFL
jgi:predicted ATPase with chaperone activity